MTLAAPQSENVFLTYTDWQGYLRYLAAVEGSGVRVTYDRGRLELMTPSRKHEKTKTALGSLIEYLAIRRELDFEPGGSMTFSREDLDRGLEPDECYWFGEDYTAVAGRDSYDSLKDPPPSLVLEVGVSSSSIDKLDMYASMKVREVWHWRESGFRFLLLSAEGYGEVSHSSIFEDIDTERISSYLDQVADRGISRAVRNFP